MAACIHLARQRRIYPQVAIPGGHVPPRCRHVQVEQLGQVTSESAGVPLRPARAACRARSARPVRSCRSPQPDLPARQRPVPAYTFTCQDPPASRSMCPAGPLAMTPTVHRTSDTIPVHEWAGNSNEIAGGTGGARTHDRRIVRSTAHALCALAAQMTRVIALMALAALGLTEAPVHNPVHAGRQHRPATETERSDQNLVAAMPRLDATPASLVGEHPVSMVASPLVRDWRAGNAERIASPRRPRTQICKAMAADRAERSHSHHAQGGTRRWLPSE